MVEGYLKSLVKYIKKNLAKGYTLDALKWALLSQGYSRSEISKAVKIANEELAREAPKIKEKPVIKMEREPLVEEAEKKEKKKGFWKRVEEFFSD